MCGEDCTSFPHQHWAKRTLCAPLCLYLPAYGWVSLLVCSCEDVLLGARHCDMTCLCGPPFTSAILSSTSPSPASRPALPALAERVNPAMSSEARLESEGRSSLWKGKFQGEEHYRGIVPEIAGWWPICLVKKIPGACGAKMKQFFGINQANFDEQTFCYNESFYCST